jgi:hypothetical protein
MAVHDKAEALALLPQPEHGIFTCRERHLGFEALEQRHDTRVTGKRPSPQVRIHSGA